MNSHIKTITTLIAMLGLLILVSCTQKEGSRSVPPVQRVKWHTYQEGLNKAIQEQKTVFLSVHANWCHPCHILEAEVYNDSLVAQYLNDSLVAIKVDYEADHPLPCGGKLKDAKLCMEEDWKDPKQISALPFYAFLRPNATRILSKVGQIKRDEFLLLLMEMKDVELK